MNRPGYLRQPALHRDTLVFVCDDDLWTAPASGGLAQRLTASLGEPSHPAISPDGAHIAYISRDERQPEVSVMPLRGGPSRRLTWLGPDVMVRGFTPEGKILFVTTQGQPFFRAYRAHTIDIEGGPPELLPLGQVNHLSFGPRGARVIGRNTADPARWKRYRGGTAGHLWVDAEGSGQFRRMSKLAGNITSPMWLGERIYFLSDAEGYGNLYSCLPDEGDLRRHTDHEGFYARHAQTDGARIVYQCGAEIWLYDPATDQSRRVEIEVPSPRTQAQRRFVSASDHLEDAALHPKGHSLSLTARGQLFSLALWEGAVRQHEHPLSSRVRLPQWLADGATQVAVSDRSGEERLVVLSSAQPEGREIAADVGRVVSLAAAPVGGLVALTNHRNEIVIVDTAAGSAKVIDKSAGSATDLAWSPDGAWLAYTFCPDLRRSAIKLHEIASGRSALATVPEFRDFSPAFDPGGKYLYFLSHRSLDPVYDTVQFELSFPRAIRPYLVALAAHGAPPFEPAPRGLSDDADAGDKDEKKPGESKETKPIRVDLDGIERRVAAFPVPEGLYRQIAGLPGKVLWTQFPIPGAHGRGGHSDGDGTLEVFEFESGRARTLQPSVDAFELSLDGKTLLLRKGGELRAISPSRGPEDDADDDAPPFSRESGRVDLSRIRLEVQPESEWRQMLREVWRLQRDQFWVGDLSGVDWEGVWKRYSPLIERVATRGELSDLVWEIQGELGTSHAYEYDGDHRAPPKLDFGSLGADLRYDSAEGGYRVEHIVEGDPWEPGADSPLRAIGAEVQPGEVILAVDGRKVSQQTPPQALLVRKAGSAAHKVELLLRAKGSQQTRTVLVSPLKDEAPARYREWVERNRRLVHDLSGGEVGYLHIPDMMSAGFAEFHRYFALESDRDALVVDVRYNRGGHVSSLLLEKLARRRLGYDMQRWGPPMPYPAESPLGPLVALTNEHAGSDGDIFSHCFKLMGLGPLVGKRTWGGVIGIWPRHRLVDGTTTTQPEFSFWFSDVGWAVENYGTDPDIDVDNAPQDVASGKDRQLEVAVQVALDRRKEAKILRPAFTERPHLAPGPLPPRPR